MLGERSVFEIRKKVSNDFKEYSTTKISGHRFFFIHKQESRSEIWGPSFSDERSEMANDTQTHEILVYCKKMMC